MTDLAIDGLGKTSASDFVNFAIFVDQHKIYKFLYACESSWRDVRKLPVKVERGSKDSYLSSAFQSVSSETRDALG